MSDPAILFVKPKAISRGDKRVLQDAGVIVIEVDDPASVKFTRAATEISSTAMLGMAAAAIQAGDWNAKAAFTRLICEAIVNAAKPSPPPVLEAMDATGTKDG